MHLAGGPAHGNGPTGVTIRLIRMVFFFWPSGRDLALVRAFVEVSDNHHDAPCFLRDGANAFQHRAYLVRPVHVNVRTDIRLKRVEDKQLCARLDYRLFNPQVGKAQFLFALVNDDHALTVRAGLDKAGLHRIAQAVLGCLKNNAHGFGGAPRLRQGRARFKVSFLSAMKKSPLLF